MTLHATAEDIIIRCIGSVSGYHNESKVRLRTKPVTQTIPRTARRPRLAAHISRFALLLLRKSDPSLVTSIGAPVKKQKNSRSFRFHQTAVLNVTDPRRGQMNPDSVSRTFCRRSLSFWNGLILICFIVSTLQTQGWFFSMTQRFQYRLFACFFLNSQLNI